MSRFNRLYLGEARAVISELDGREATNDDLKVALCNALERIHQLEEKLDLMERKSRPGAQAR